MESRAYLSNHFEMFVLMLPKYSDPNAADASAIQTSKKVLININEMFCEFLDDGGTDKRRSLLYFRLLNIQHLAAIDGAVAISVSIAVPDRMYLMRIAHIITVTSIAITLQRDIVQHYPHDVCVHVL
jgi:hypothetical protein